jgi:transcriptional regulator with XRE-family HTH domain
LSELDERDVRAKIAGRLVSAEFFQGECLRLMRLAVGLTQKRYAEMTAVDLRVRAAILRRGGNPLLDALEKLAGPYDLKVSFVNPL